MTKVLNIIMDNFEIILTVAVIICLIFYIIDGFTYRPLRKKLYERFKTNTADNDDRRAYLDRLSALNTNRLSKKQKALYTTISNNLIDGEALTGKKLYWLKRPTYPKEKSIEFFSGLFWVLFIVWFARSFLYEPFKIPSGSMEPTLQAGDFILTNKFTYGFRLPVTHQKIFSVSEVKHGDIIVFRYPKNEKINYIKRVIGLPGDKVRFDSGRVWINGKEQPIEAIAEKKNLQIYRESLVNMTHQLQFEKDTSLRVNLAAEFIVPEHHYFVLGDNRDHSQDSRFWGFVPEKNLVGKALFIWMNSDCILGRGACDRIGSSLTQ